MNDGRILAAEFEHDRREVFCRRGHDDLRDCGAAGKKDMVPWLFKQCGGFRHCAENNGKRFAVEVFWQVAHDNRAGGGRDF